MYTALQQDHQQINDLLTVVKERALTYLHQLDTIPNNRPEPKLDPPLLGEDGAGTMAALDHFYQHFADTLVASSGPRYWGFVTGGTTPAAIAGDWLTTVFDQNTQTLSGPGDVSAHLEQQTIALLLQLLGLPDTFNGGFVTGATMSNFTCLAVGRQWAGMTKGNDTARDGIQIPIKVFSATPHSSAVKALAMLGLGSNNIIPVKTMEGSREAMDINDLHTQLLLHADHPTIVISSGGTVNSVDFDDMQAIAALRETVPFYWHIDAAFGGFAACSAQYAHLLKGWEGADSIAVDCHKWMNVPYDSAVYLVKRVHARLQVQTFQNGNAPYLGNPDDQFSYLNFGPENSRRFRALAAWFSLIAYGKNGFRWMVDNSIAMAQLFGQRITAETDFVLAAPIRLNVVCFTPKEETGREERIKAVLAALNTSGRVFMTPSRYKGIPCIRAAFVNWRTSAADIDIAIGELLERPVLSTRQQDKQ